MKKNSLNGEEENKFHEYREDLLVKINILLHHSTYFLTFSQTSIVLSTIFYLVIKPSPN